MEYIIKKGDTLSAIAKKFGTTVSEIKRLNPIIKDVNKINVGWSITIPELSTSFQRDVEKCLEDLENLPSFQKVMKQL